MRSRDIPNVVDADARNDFQPQWAACMDSRSGTDQCPQQGRRPEKVRSNASEFRRSFRVGNYLVEFRFRIRG